MIGMPSLPIGQDDRFRLKLANHRCQPQLVLPKGLHVRVRHAERLAPLHAEQLGRLRRFFRSQFRRPSRSHLTCGQVQDAGLVACLRHLQKRSAAGQLHVVRVRRNRQQVQFHSCSPWHANSNRANQRYGNATPAGMCYLSGARTCRIQRQRIRRNLSVAGSCLLPAPPNVSAAPSLCTLPKKAPTSSSTTVLLVPKLLKQSRKSKNSAVAPSLCKPI